MVWTSAPRRIGKSKGLPMITIIPLLILISTLLSGRYLQAADIFEKELKTFEFFQKIQQKEIAKIFQDPPDILDGLGRRLEQEIRGIKKSIKAEGLMASISVPEEWKKRAGEIMSKVKKIFIESGLADKIFQWLKSFIRSTAETIWNQIKSLPDFLKIFKKLFWKPPSPIIIEEV